MHQHCALLARPGSSSSGSGGTGSGSDSSYLSDKDLYLCTLEWEVRRVQIDGGLRHQGLYFL